MAMNETVILVLAGSAGVLLGVFFFGGLWWTVRKGPFVETAGVFVSSAACCCERASFWPDSTVSGGHWDRLLACLLGFVMARFLVTRLTRAAEKPTYLAQEASHAP
jgi:F1F0 ATPase subunit 2